MLTKNHFITVLSGAALASCLHRPWPVGIVIKSRDPHPTLNPSLDPTPSPSSDPDPDPDPDDRIPGDPADPTNDRRPVSFSGSLGEQALAFLKSYSPDGYYIVTENNRLEGGTGYLRWLDSGKFYLTDTMVHEECHGLNNQKSGKRFGYAAYYIGDEKSIVLKEQEIFRSDLIASSIPKELQSFRFDPYLSPYRANLGSQVNGVYGLLEEFVCYYNGAKSTLESYGFYERTGRYAEYKQQMQVFSAYYEFKFFILTYFIYAKAHRPAIYQGLIEQRELREAFTTINQKFEAVANAYLRQLSVIPALKNGLTIGLNDYEKLNSELLQDKYLTMINNLKP